MLDCGTVLGTTVAAAHSFVHIASHVRPLVVLLHYVLHTTLSGMTGDGWMM